MGADNNGDEAVAEATAEDAAAPAREQPFEMTVVGLGASAGGVQALQSFFENAPADSGMAFVVVLHLSPEHESRLAELLARSTAMPVTQVTDAVLVEPNHVYVIPPAKHLAMSDGHLLLNEQDQSRGRRVAVDLFFRTLAAAHGPQAAAVVLSGTGADGALGLKQIKERGGLTVAQDPRDAEQDGMPRSAIGTGMVDYVLPARDMAAQIIAYRDASQRMRLPDEAAPSPAQRDDRPDAEAALREILGQVRAQTGHDFAHYKRATVLRRIGRRLQVNRLADLPAYRDYLRGHHTEVNDLLNDLLISVTQFFRDREAWETLERDVIPRLFEDQDAEGQVRAWCCGCATGEEAYSLAILLCEQSARTERPRQPILFATDIDDDAIAHAREGSYPDTIAADVSAERLRRWFYRENGRYRIKKEVREAVLFAAHDLLGDTPFSRLDLVTCRNVLIYLNREAQVRVFDTFHFALRPNGRLFLGTAESTEGATSLFTPTDKQHRLYVRRPVARHVPPLPVAPVRNAATAGATGAPSHWPALPPPATPDRTGEAPPLYASAGELHQATLELYAPPSALVSQEHDILHLSNGAGRFLRFSGGDPTTNLLRVVHPDLRIDLSTALYAAGAEGRDQTRNARAALEGGASRPVRITVRPVREPEGARGYLLVLFEELTPEADAAGEGDEDSAAAAAAADGETAGEATGQVARQLEAEIGRLRAQLRSTVEQYEASMEQFKASNEELQAMNEEMRSAAEELETSKEELQSVNEELSTVNQELKGRVEEVSRVNSDLQNLLASTDIGTVFLDRDLRVKRYTPSIETLFNIILSDVGRPLAHVTHRLDYDGLSEDAERVMERLTPVEREVGSVDGRRFMARLAPYRTLDDRIDGVVVTFVDVTDRKAAEEAVRRANERLAQANAALEDRVVERTRELARTHEARTELLRQLVSAQEEERGRVSRELHDETGQDLTALLLGLKTLQDAAGTPTASQETAERLRGIAETLTRNLHRMAAQLRPTALDDVGLPDALANYIEEWSSRGGIPADFEAVGFGAGEPRLLADVETTVYRVAQEALTNVTRHAAGATRVSITLQRRPRELLMTVEDDGAGFEPENEGGPSSGGAGAVGEADRSGRSGQNRRLGLAGMRERAALAGGTLTIESAPGKGATIYLNIPLPPPDPAGVG